MTRRPDRLTRISLAAHRGLHSAALRQEFAQPGSAIATMTADLQQVWDSHRTDDPGERRIGTLGLASGAYLQWIGYSDQLVVECSSNTYLRGDARLTVHEQAALVRAGFSPPDEDEPNFWLRVHDRWACAAAASTVVAALTAAFGVYAG